MSPRVYLSKHTCPTTHEEETPVGVRIPRRRTTVKDLHSRLQHADQRAAVRLVRRITVWLARLGHRGPMAVFGEGWGRRPAGLSAWQPALLLRGMASVVYGHRGGRPPQLPPRHQQRVGELSEAGPRVGGGATAWGKAVRLRGLIWRACGVLDKRPSGGTRLHTLGFALQKARVVAAHLAAVTRRAWLEATGPARFRVATRCPGLLRCEEEASWAPWGSWRYPWARRGHQPAVPTRGRGKATRGWAPWRLALDACALKAGQGAVTQQRPKRAGRG
jgi:hypothetical protein